MFRFLNDEKRDLWLKASNLEETDVLPCRKIRSSHFKILKL